MVDKGALWTQATDEVRKSMSAKDIGPLDDGATVGDVQDSPEFWDRVEQRVKALGG